MAAGRGWSYYFIDLRRRYINDRIWFGLGLMAIGFGNLASDNFLPAWLLILVGLAGLGLVVWGWTRK